MKRDTLSLVGSPSRIPVQHMIKTLAATLSLFASTAIPALSPSPVTSLVRSPESVATGSSTSQSWLSWLFGRFYVAELSGAQVVPPVAENTGGIALLWLNPRRTRLYYWLLLDGVDIKDDFGARTAPNDVTQIHFHLAAPGANGPHALNVFGPPSEDDLDLRVYPALELVTGAWDDSDAFVMMPGIGDTRRLSDHLGDLRDGNLYLQVHTNRNPRPGELRGQISRLRFW